MWKVKLSTLIEQKRGFGLASKWRAKSARCCAPIDAQGQRRVCGARLLVTQGLRVTHANPPRTPPLPISGDAGLALGKHHVHGAWGTRVEASVRLLLELRSDAQRRGDPAAAKAVIFSRHEPTLKLLASACAMNRVSCTSLDKMSSEVLALFCSSPNLQAEESRT